MVEKYNQCYKLSKCLGPISERILATGEVDLSAWHNGPTVVNNFEISKITQESIDMIIDYDASIVGFDRKEWCKNWLLGHNMGFGLYAFGELT